MGSTIEQGSGVGRSITLMLILITIACVGLIGAAGYVKFELDRNELVLIDNPTEVQPDSFVPVQDMDKQVDTSKQRQQAKQNLRAWSLALTFIAWSSVILAAGLAIGLYLVIQRRQSPALRAIAQSISNLAGGDMQTPIWGTERTDSIGDLARAVDKARCHFSQLPDMSVLSDQGPVRIKFEGGARTLFEAMMQQITTQAARIGDEASDLASTAAGQHKMLAEIPVRLNSALEQIQRNDKANNQTIQRLSQNLEQASGQLDQLVPFMQKRAQSMAEVTQIAGSQVTATFKSLLESENNLRDSTGKSLRTVEELAASTKELGERIFAALNILQASSKVLNETTESSQSRLKELLETLGSSESKLTQVVDRVELRLEATAKAEENLNSLASRTERNADQMDGVIKAISEKHGKLGEQIVTATQKLDSIITSFDGAQHAMSDALQNISRDGGLLNGMFQELKTSNEQVLAKLSRTSQTGHEVVQHLAECSQTLMQQLQERLVTNSQSAQIQIDSMARQSGDLAVKTETATQALINAVDEINASQSDLKGVHSRFTDLLDEVGGKLEKQVTETFGRTEQMAEQNCEKLATMTTSIDQALQRLTVLSQLTGTLGTVAGQLGQLIPSLTGTQTVTEGSRDIVIPTEEIAGKLLAEFENHWRTSVEQIDSVRDDISMLIEQQKNQLEMRLVLLDKQIKALPDNIESNPKQVSLLHEITEALGAMNEQLVRLEPDYHDGIKRNGHQG
ncbi:MAG: hypothetical protein PHX43_03020 [Alphaproteobacteria bacterium]|nr:hypothetical protein [Alphaproteobacteria bacterium]